MFYIIADFLFDVKDVFVYYRYKPIVTYVPYECLLPLCVVLMISYKHSGTCKAFLFEIMSELQKKCNSAKIFHKIFLSPKVDIVL